MKSKWRAVRFLKRRGMGLMFEDDLMIPRG